MGKIPFVTDSDTGRIPVNWYPAKDDEVGVLMWGTPGKVEVAEAGYGPIRGMLKYGAYVYLVSGNSVYRMNSSWTCSLIGTIGTSTGMVWMECNGSQICIVDCAKGYILTISTLVLAEITDTDFPVPSSLTYQDGYFIVTEKDTQNFYISSLLDGTAWDALDFATGEGKPDLVVSTLMDHRELWMFGEESIDVFYNSGDADFPFYRTQGGFLETGISGANAVCKLDNSIAWMTEKGQVVKASGYVPQIISTRKLEALWSGFDLSLAEFFAYIYLGHWFLQINFTGTGDDRSFCYDAATQLWHERAYGTTPNLHRDLATCHVWYQRKHLVGSRNSGKIFELKTTVFTDDTATITRLMDFPGISKDGSLISFPRLQIEFDHGKALLSGQGSDPEAMLTWSDDGANTWSNEHWAKMGAIGKYKARSMWHRMGSSRNRMFRLTITDPVSPKITGFNLMQPKVGR